MQARLLIALVVAFVVLVAAGLWLTAEDEVRAPVARSEPVAPPAEAEADAGRPPVRYTSSPPAPADAGRIVTVPPEQWPERVRPPASTTTVVPEAVDTPNVAKEDVALALAAAKPLVEQCFADAAGKNPGYQKAVLRFTIANGVLKEPEVIDSTIVDPWVHACFIEALLDARFPPPRGGGEARVAYPFTYEVEPLVEDP